MSQVTLTTTNSQSVLDHGVYVYHLRWMFVREVVAMVIQLNCSYVHKSVV